ncbi:hypothetical protein C8Q79DRAFT_1012883 [Trametes meyenii]|nr:hypothetical protein C8Q79DRAFT_1012883 [Trametes meyenii]
MPSQRTHSDSQNDSGSTRPRQPQARPRIEFPDFDNPLTWISDLPGNLTVWEELAVGKYLLDPTDLAGYAYDQILNERDQVIILYLERDVEELAWQRHGGPAGFAQAIQIKLDEHKARYGGSDRGFRCPHSYRRRQRFDLRFFPFDRYVGMSRTLKRAEAELPAWLWRAANAALDETYGPPDLGPKGWDRRRTPLMAYLIQRHTSLYPERPPVDAFIPDNLSQVLKEAPMVPDKAQWGQDVVGLTFIGSLADGHYEWNEIYLERLFTELNKAIEPSLVDWETARWSVYDVYSRTLGRGLQPHPANLRKHRYDKARHWLYPYQYEADSIEMHQGPRGRCPAGHRFNSLLPPVPPPSLPSPPSPPSPSPSPPPSLPSPPPSPTAAADSPP